MNDLDREYIGRQAEEIKQLQAENKALKETLDKTTDLVVDYQERLVKVEESRDELLEAYKKHRWDMCRLGVKEELIKKARFVELVKAKVINAETVIELKKLGFTKESLN